MPGEVAGGGGIKVFWFFSSEKNILLYAVDFLVPRARPEIGEDGRVEGVALLV